MTEPFWVETAHWIHPHPIGITYALDLHTFGMVDMGGVAFDTRRSRPMRSEDVALQLPRELQ